MFEQLSDSALTARLYEIRKEERALLVEFLHCLNELDRRGTLLELGFSSTFVFCTDYLGMPKSTTYRRTKSAELLARFPVIGEFLADGRLNTRTLVILRDVLEEKCLHEILDRAAGRTEDQVKELVAALRPQPALPDLFRRLPAPELARASSRREPLVEDHEVPAPSSENAQAVAPALPLVAAPKVETATRRASLEPLAPELHVMRVTVSGDFKRDLEAVKDALSHKLPGASLEEVLHECLRVTLAACEKRRRGAGRKKTAEKPRRRSRFIPAAIRSQVWERDQGSCAFVGKDGRRCSSRHQLEVHHRDPHGKHGEPTVENLALYCRAHNGYAARQDYGAAFIARKIADKTSRARERGMVWVADCADSPRREAAAYLRGPGGAFAGAPGG